MKPDEIKDEIKKLDVKQKLTLVEDLWDDIAASNEAIPLYDWQKQELDKRLEAYENGKLKTFDGDSVHESLRDKYR